MFESNIVEYASMHFFLMYSAEALVFLTVTAYSLRSLRKGAWAGLGAAGGATGGLTAAVLAMGWAQVEFADSLAVFDFIADRAWLGEVMDWSRPAAVLFLGLALWRASARSR